MLDFTSYNCLFIIFFYLSHLIPHIQPASEFFVVDILSFYLFCLLFVLLLVFSIVSSVLLENSNLILYRMKMYQVVFLLHR